jgi:hypothetical protein
VRTDGVEPPQPKRRGYNPGSSPVLSVRTRVAGRIRTDTDGAHDPGCLPLHHGHHGDGDDRIRTGDL